MPCEAPRVKVLGVVIPTAEVASADNAEKVGVVATTATVRSHIYRTELCKLNPRLGITELAAPALVPAIENNDFVRAEEEVRRLAPSFAGCDSLILGCTHYPFLLDTIRRITGPEITVIDPAPAVAKHLVDVMNEDGIKMTPGGKPGVCHDKVILLASGSDQNLKSAFENLKL